MSPSTATDEMVNPAIFTHLQSKIDEDAAVREELRDIVQTLEKQGRLPSRRTVPYINTNSK